MIPGQIEGARAPSRGLGSLLSEQTDYLNKPTKTTQVMSANPINSVL